MPLMHVGMHMSLARGRRKSETQQQQQQQQRPQQQQQQQQQQHLSRSLSIIHKEIFTQDYLPTYLLYLAWLLGNSALCFGVEMLIGFFIAFFLFFLLIFTRLALSPLLLFPRTPGLTTHTCQMIWAFSSRTPGITRDASSAVFYSPA